MHTALFLLTLTGPLSDGSQPAAKPDALVMRDGAPVESASDWRQRRAEILALFEEHVYGRTPAKLDPDPLSFEIVEVDRGALDGHATRKQVVVRYATLEMNLLIYLPNAGDAEPKSTFVGLNFYGNQSVHRDPAIRLPTSWVRNHEPFGITENRAVETSRGVRASRWPVKTILARGYAFATMYYGDIDPDFDDGFANGVHPLLAPAKAGERPADAWGSIGAWAWGLSRVMDYLETDTELNHDEVAVMGHSRLGKTSLWAGAQDERFAIVISNDSGCGGAALSRRRAGETVARINKVFPHWFCRNFRRFDDNETALPVDQHLLVALAAPRPVYIASASQDAWADPLGEFMAARGAHGVYRLLGREGLPASEQPRAGGHSHGAIGYHLREGKHDVTEWDWKHYLDFADKHFERR